MVGISAGLGDKLLRYIITAKLIIEEREPLLGYEAKFELIFVREGWQHQQVLPCILSYVQNGLDDVRRHIENQSQDPQESLGI